MKIIIFATKNTSIHHPNSIDTMKKVLLLFAMLMATQAYCAEQFVSFVSHENSAMCLTQSSDTIVYDTN